MNLLACTEKGAVFSLSFFWLLFPFSSQKPSCWSSPLERSCAGVLVRWLCGGVQDALRPVGRQRGFRPAQRKEEAQQLPRPLRPQRCRSRRKYGSLCLTPSQHDFPPLSSLAGARCCLFHFLQPPHISLCVSCWFPSLGDSPCTR